MAETDSENPQGITENMEAASEPAPKFPSVKREREEEEGEDGSKKPKVEGEEEEEGEEGSKKPKVEGEGEEEVLSVKLGPKIFESGEEMCNYFYKFLHFWPPNVNINKYEQMVLLDLLKKGHEGASKKIGVGIRAFQICYHPKFKSRCFFVVRTDGTSKDFSFKKCVRKLMPLPENMKLHATSDEASNGKSFGGRGGRGGRRGRGYGRRGGFGK